MANILNMQDMRYLNIFEKITKVRTRFFIKYNEAIIFCVPKQLLSKSIGKNAQNIRQISGIIKKRIKVVVMPNGIEDAEKFIQAIVDPIKFKSLEIKEEEIVLTAGNQNKASLFGRNKKRLLEMKKIVKDFFGREFRIA